MIPLNEAVSLVDVILSPQILKRTVSVPSNECLLYFADLAVFSLQQYSPLFADLFHTSISFGNAHEGFYHIPDPGCIFS